MKRTRADVAERFRWQAGWCGKLGSPLYRDLLDHAAADIERGGPVWDVLADDTADGDGLLPGAQALRLMGAVHRLVLEGRAPELAAFYPSAGGVVAAGARDGVHRPARAAARRGGRAGRASGADQRARPLGRR